MIALIIVHKFDLDANQGWLNVDQYWAETWMQIWIYAHQSQGDGQRASEALSKLPVATYL